MKILNEFNISKAIFNGKIMDYIIVSEDLPVYLKEAHLLVWNKNLGWYNNCLVDNLRSAGLDANGIKMVITFLSTLN